MRIEYIIGGSLMALGIALTIYSLVMAVQIWRILRRVDRINEEIARGRRK